MKIAVITSLAGPGSVAGGVWEVVVNQVTALCTAGHEVTLVAGWLGQDPPQELRGLPVSLVPVRPIIKQMGLRFLVGRGWIETVRSALKDADLAHIHVCRDYLSLSAARTAQRMRIPFVVQPHGMLSAPKNLLFKGFDRILTRPALKQVAHFVTLTDAEVPHLSTFGVAALGNTTIHNAVPLPTLTWSPPKGPQRLLFASRLHPRKQVMVFAESVKRLRELGHDVQGVIAGSDEGDLAELHRFCSTAADSNGLQYIGQLSREELNRELTTATAFVFPARNEPFGLVLVEALSIGTPVVSTTETPLMSIISDAGAARFAEPTVDRFTEALAALLTDQAAQTELSHKGRQLYRERWTNEAMVQNLTAMYSDVLGRTPARTVRF
ncbi:glycosyltransferase family 4 protein [Kineosporia sp. NBRC 101731]|uniref:glycosyltransferase family 4 protein n=1 Tax=Kineosporia sp. NBRC 101731 TaxID=3032199 RepID=UPI0024A2DAE0|nr:glycosyltransferase family 4 protein [Kineosporia sp. NBRC 101731]GLY29854.1 glycosyl transferase [Kineosporia sp. NBRC 101731]